MMIDDDLTALRISMTILPDELTRSFCVNFGRPIGCLDADCKLSLFDKPQSFDRLSLNYRELERCLMLGLDGLKIQSHIDTKITHRQHR